MNWQYGTILEDPGDDDEPYMVVAPATPDRDEVIFALVRFRDGRVVMAIDDEAWTVIP